MCSHDTIEKPKDSKGNPIILNINKIPDLEIPLVVARNIYIYIYIYLYLSIYLINLISIKIFYKLKDWFS